MAADTLWSAIVPMKDSRKAKSRLGGEPALRRQLAVAMARDTLNTVVSTVGIQTVVVVCDRQEDAGCFALPGVRVVVRQGLALNDAILAGAALARGGRDNQNLAVLPGDLPYLQSCELEAALAWSSGVSSACVADRTGRGTTLLTARAGTNLAPEYGEDSLARHRLGGAIEVDVPAWSGLRRDVDVPEDLTLNGAIGPRTRRLIEQLRQQSVGVT
jgi:2-phospho-L-lactate guanylyltransferase